MFFAVVVVVVVDQVIVLVLEVEGSCNRNRCCCESICSNTCRSKVVVL